MQDIQLSNDVGTREGRGRRWVYRVGALAVRQPPYTPALLVAVAVFSGIIGVLWGILLEDAIVGLFAVAFKVSVWLAVAALYYERKNFYEVILEQEQRIVELEHSLHHTSAADASR
jgi:hypothetical protein